MVCNKCYYNNSDNSKFCTKCGEALEQTNQNNNNINQNSYVQNNNTSNIPTYNVANAVVALIICFTCCSNIPGIIFAVLSLVEGSKVSSFAKLGDIASAKACLDTAKKWVKYAWISLAIWVGAIIIFYVLYFVFIFGIAFLSEM